MNDYQLLTHRVLLQYKMIWQQRHKEQHTFPLAVGDDYF